MASPMRTISLPSGDQIPVLGQGTWGLGESRARRSSEIAALRRGLDIGMNLIDTAEMYANGDAEILVGEAIAEAPGALAEHRDLVSGRQRDGPHGTGHESSASSTMGRTSDERLPARGRRQPHRPCHRRPARRPSASSGRVVLERLGGRVWSDPGGRRAADDQAAAHRQPGRDRRPHHGDGVRARDRDGRGALPGNFSTPAWRPAWPTCSRPRRNRPTPARADALRHRAARNPGHWSTSPSWPATGSSNTSHSCPNRASGDRRRRCATCRAHVRRHLAVRGISPMRVLASFGGGR